MTNSLRLLLLACFVLATGCAVTRPYELLQLTRANANEYFGHLYPGITDSKDLEAEPFAKPFRKPNAQDVVVEYGAGNHPALAFATYDDGRYCFDYRTLKVMPDDVTAAVDRFNSQYSVVIRTHQSLDEIAAGDEWPVAQPTHTSTVVDHPHYLLSRPSAQAAVPEKVLQLCQQGPRLTPDVKFLTVTLVSSRNWRNNSLLVWDFEGKKEEKN